MRSPILRVCLARELSGSPLQPRHMDVVPFIPPEQAREGTVQA
jgi:hypothetical protein